MASFGVDFWEGKEPLTSEVKTLMKKFDSISVREESGIDICRETFGVDEAVNVLDPTLMLNREDYEAIINKTKNLKYEVKEKYIASMILDESSCITKTIDNIGENLNLRVEKIKGETINILGKKITFNNKVGEWLNYLKNVNLVITDSFYCVAFSIIFNKEFIVLANPERGIARLENI
ncbi:polysaccharide pyruvyl transferase family protein [Fusobacterium pseudoperiodonticum]|uniref:polysaccharide pyruvyl transferase family protein n=1 Tax=Fusobacterium pseudoperiodonticum TaxID=2663009 RepID=UPI0021F3750F|nr:polysaccharide pyruvyl transferase family protein [Fusobacterium pseudoperiodonticum]